MDNVIMTSDFEIKCRLIDDYKGLWQLRKIATKEGAVETVKAIDVEIQFIKLKLQPLELPED